MLKVIKLILLVILFFVLSSKTAYSGVFFAQCQYTAANYFTKAGTAVQVYCFAEYTNADGSVKGYSVSEPYVFTVGYSVYWNVLKIPPVSGFSSIKCVVDGGGQSRNDEKGNCIIRLPVPNDGVPRTFNLEFVLEE